MAAYGAYRAATGHQPPTGIGDFPTSLLIGSSVVSQIMTIGLVVFLVRSVHGFRLSDVFKWKGVGERPWTFAAALGLGVSAFNSAAQYFFPPKDGADIYILELVKTWNGLLTLSFLAVFVAPICEELFFRGYFFAPAEKKFGGIGAAAISALFFASIHTMQLGDYLIGVALIFLMGMVSGWLRSTTGGLRSSFVFHTSYNAVLVGLEIVRRILSGE